MSRKKKIFALVVFLLVLLLVGCSKNEYSGSKYSGSEGGKTVYQDVKTDVVELTVCYYSDTPPVSDVFIKNDEGTFFKEEAFREYKELIPISEDIFNKLNIWVDEYNIKSWDGYNMTQEDVMDGGGFGLNITLSTGETITANGSNAYPQGYREANKILKEIIAEALEEINKSSNLFISDRWSFYNDFVDSPIEGDIVLDKGESILLKYHYPNKGEHYINRTKKCISVSPMGIDGIYSDAYVVIGVTGVYKGESFVQIFDSKGNVIDEILINVTNETFKEDEAEGEWCFLEGEGGWHQRVTDDHLKKAQYIFDQGIDRALESHCVLLYKDEARDFALYYSFKSYQYDDYEDVLIVSNGKKTVARGYGAWDRVDLREVASSYDIDHDGFEEIIIPVTTGTGTGYLQTSFFVFDSSDDVTYDELSVCGPEGIIYNGDSSKLLQNVSIEINQNDGTVRYKLANNVKYEGHIKGLIDIYSDISKARVGDSVNAQLTESGKLVFIAHPCFYGDDFVGGAFAFTGDTENDVCDIFYEIEYLEDGTFKCVSVEFDKKL